MRQQAFKAFDGASRIDASDLVVECVDDAIQISGSLTIAKDQRGLADALAIRDALDDAIKTMRSGPLPDHAKHVRTPEERASNPFGKS